MIWYASAAAVRVAGQGRGTCLDHLLLSNMIRLWRSIRLMGGENASTDRHGDSTAGQQMEWKDWITDPATIRSIAETKFRQANCSMIKR